MSDRQDVCIKAPVDAEGNAVPLTEPPSMYAEDGRRVPIKRLCIDAETGEWVADSYGEDFPVGELYRHREFADSWEAIQEDFDTRFKYVPSAGLTGYERHIGRKMFSDVMIARIRALAEKEAGER